MSETKKRRRASENPFYILATIYGEHTDEIDFDLNEQNRGVWNAWACQGLSDDEKDEITKTYPRLIIPDWTEDLKKTVNDAFAKRLPGGPIPDHSSDINFRGTDFKQPVGFVGFLFLKDAVFMNAQFTKAAIFTHAQFTEGANFINAQFTNAASFMHARFTNRAHFRYAQFTQGASFSYARFKEKACFTSSRFEAHSYFQGAIFSEALDFTDASFARPVNFRQARFEKYYPILEGTNLHGKTTLTAQPKYWPKATDHSQYEGTYTQTLEKAAAGCAHLRHNMTAQGLPDDAHFFFRREMGCKLAMAGGVKKLPLWFYGKLSDYGYSYGRPLWWLIQLWLVWTLGYLVFHHSKGGFSKLTEDFSVLWSDWDAVFDAAGLSFANIFVFFGFHKRFDMKWSGDSNWLIAFTGLETILLFFLGLGLRNQFRLK